jgi:ankyrin repeat protein
MLAALKDTRRVDFLYEELVTRSQAEPNGWQRVLPWIALSKRPLRPSELRHALAAEEAHSDFTEDTLVDLENLVISSRGLLVIRRRDDATFVQFCHWTAADFFKRREAGAAHEWPLRIARACLYYLSLSAFATGPRDADEQYQQRVASYPFYEYASSYWAAHFREASDPATPLELQEQAIKLLANRACVASSAQALLRTTSLSSVQPSRVQPAHSNVATGPVPVDLHALSLVAYLDLPTLASALLTAADNERDLSSVTEVDSLGRTALLWAACGGGSAVTRVLLEHGCPLDDSDKAGDTALSLAASLGHTDVARVLLEGSVKLDASARPPLTLAAEGGHRDLVQMLLDHGADHHWFLENGDSALHRAAANGHSEVIQVLLYPFVADGLLQHQNHNGHTPLFTAASHGHAEAVKLLLAAGADARIVGDPGGQTPLLRAVLNQHWSVVQALLASEADLGSYDAEFLLDKAIELEGWEAIDVLLHRADAGLPPSTPRRLLCQAAREGKESVVRRLMEIYPDAAQTPDGEG